MRLKMCLTEDYLRVFQGLKLKICLLTLTNLPTSTEIINTSINIFKFRCIYFAKRIDIISKIIIFLLCLKIFSNLFIDFITSGISNGNLMTKLTDVTVFCQSNLTHIIRRLVEFHQSNFVECIKLDSSQNNILEDHVLVNRSLIY